MKKFLINCSIILGIFAVTIVSLYILTAGYNKDSYLRAYDMKCRLLEKTESPRILFVGDSNLAFGLDSKRIQDSLHINVVNTGLHLGIGSRYMIDDILLYAREGDIIVIAIENGGISGDGNGESLTLSTLLSCHPEKLKLLNWKQWTNVIAGMPKAIRAELNQSISKNEHAYRASGFNEFGDEVRHWGLESLPKVPIKKEGDSFDIATANYLLGKIKRLDEKCEMFLMPAVTIESNYELNKDLIESASEWYSDNGYPYIVPLQRHILPDEDTYDDKYHMNKRGVDKYTSSVIEALRPIVLKRPLL